MTENEAIEELKYDYNELGKAIPCDTSWGCSFENAYGMAIQALEKQIPKKVKNSGERIPFEWYCPTCGELLCDDGFVHQKEYIVYCPWCGRKLGE